ncbi:MAG: hypothetical protein K8R63_13790, partial [Bacteroidales bacterium]|nr:hypothetical protein [Bacteroidales bacterium]
KVRDPRVLGADPVKFRYRQYSLDGRRNEYTYEPVSAGAFAYYSYTIARPEKSSGFFYSLKSD